MIELILSLLIIPGTLELFILTTGALFPKKRETTSEPIQGRLAVIIPAHNEETRIAKTLESLGRECDVIVIADNCTDKTAKVASEYGVKVLTRNDPDRKGKHYALQFAFDALKFDWYVVIDADSIVDPNFIATVKDAFSKGYDAIQVTYGVLNPEESMRARLMKIAFLAINLIRPKGREFWGLSAGILGNGFGLTRAVLEKVPYTVDSVVEDLSYHLRLVEKGYRVRFIEKTSVKGEIPTGEKGAVTQRMRWEGGRFQEIVKSVPRLLGKIAQGEFRLIEPLLDLLLLPLSYHLILILLLFVSSKAIALGALAVVVFHLFASLILGKTKVKDYLALVYIPYYLVWKIINLPRILIHSMGKMDWVRTDREE